MNLDIEILKAMIGDLMLQNIALRSALRQKEQEATQEDRPAEAEESGSTL